MGSLVTPYDTGREAKERTMRNGAAQRERKRDYMRHSVLTAVEKTLPAGKGPLDLRVAAALESLELDRNAEYRRAERIECDLSAQIMKAEAAQEEELATVRYQHAEIVAGLRALLDTRTERILVAERQTEEFARVSLARGETIARLERIRANS